MADHEFVTYETIDDGRIARIMLNRPEARNAQSRGLLVDLHGSGGFDFGGVAVNPDIRANNSASVFIRSHEGTVTARGRGDIRVSGVDYGDDD